MQVFLRVSDGDVATVGGMGDKHDRSLLDLSFRSGIIGGNLRGNEAGPGKGTQNARKPQKEKVPILIFKNLRI